MTRFLALVKTLFAAAVCGLDMEASAWDAQARLQEAIKAKQRGKSYAP